MSQEVADTTSTQQEVANTQNTPQEVVDTPSTAHEVADTPSTSQEVADTPSTAQENADTPSTPQEVADTPSTSQDQSRPRLVIFLFLLSCVLVYFVFVLLGILLRTNTLNMSFLIFRFFDYLIFVFLLKFCVLVILHSLLLHIKLFFVN